MAKITQAMIDTVLLKGSQVDRSRERILKQYAKGESSKKNIAFLKDEYGWGGSCPILSWAKLDEMHDGKGIKLSLGSLLNPDDSILLDWDYVEKRIGQLIKSGLYNKNEARKELWKTINTLGK